MITELSIGQFLWFLFPGPLLISGLGVFMHLGGDWKRSRNVSTKAWMIFFGRSFLFSIPLFLFSYILFLFLPYEPPYVTNFLLPPYLVSLGLFINGIVKKVSP